MPSDTMQSTGDDQNPRYGWVMVFVAFSLTAMSFGSLGAVGVFLKPIAAEFGWSRGSTAFGYTVAAMGAAVFGILWGFLADRNPTRYFSYMGAFAVAVSMLLLSQTAAQWQYYLSYGLFGAFGHAALVSPMWANVGQWFTRNKGTAIGIGMAGGAFGQAVVPFTARLLISAYDWQTAYMILGAAFLVLGLLIASLTRDPPAKRARLAALREGTAANSSWSLGEGRYVVGWFSAAVLFCCSCMSLAIVHVVPMLSDRGFTPELAAGALTTLMLAGVFGRMGAGKICDLMGPLPTYATMSLGQTVLVAWFPHIESLVGVYVLAVAFGFTYSGVMACMVVCVNTMVPVEVGARSWSIVGFFAWIGMGLGSYAGGAVFDVTGGYPWAFALAALLGTLNLAVLAASYISRRKRQITLAAA